LQKGILVFLMTEGMRALVVGSGKVAKRKIYKLANAGAKVTVVSKGEPIRNDPRIVPITRDANNLSGSDLDSFDLVVAATDDPDLNLAIAGLAKERGKLVNVVSDPNACSVQFPAELDYGDLLIGIATGGASPATCKALKKRIAKVIDGADLDALEMSARIRSSLKAADFQPGDIKRVLLCLSDFQKGLSDAEIIAKARELLKA